jgi:hypothetical protein
MTKQDSPSSIKQENAASGPNDLSNLVRIANEALKQEGDAGLTSANLEANARTQRFVVNLTPNDCSKFFAMIGHEDFFKMFKSYTLESEDKADQSPPTQFFEGNDSAEDKDLEIRYRAAIDAEKARLYNKILQSDHQAAKEKKYSSRKIPAFQNKWGLQISLETRMDQDLGVVNVILRKHHRGDDPISRKKTRDKVVKSLKTKILAGNLSRMLTSVKADAYDVAKDAISWQSILHSIRRFVLQYNMTLLIMIPQGVNLSAPQDVAKAKQFKDAITD